MGSYIRKLMRNENESNRERQNPDLQFSSSCKREHQRQLNERIEQNETSSSTTLYDLPLEMLDITLQKCYLHWVLNSSTEQRDEGIIRSLISVDVCFYRRITRPRYKKAISRYLKDFYKKRTRNLAIYRNNRDYLLKSIQPSDRFIDLLFFLNCITKEQRHYVQRQRSKRDKNAEILHAVRSFDGTTFSNFVKCLRKTNQTAVARIVENGGVVIKVKVNICGTTCAASENSQLLQQRIEDLPNRTKHRTHQSDKLLSQLKDKGIEILDSHLDRRTVVVWIWCHLQAAIEHIQKLYESIQLTYVLFNLANIRPSASEINQSKAINIDGNEFKKTFVFCPISVDFTERIDVGRQERVFGVTKLRNEIYVLCQPLFVSFPYVSLIRVFEDRNEFRLKKKIELEENFYPEDIESSETENCLYVSNQKQNCIIWKITRETEDKYKVIKWLTTDYKFASVNVNGQSLMVSKSSHRLMINGSDAKPIRTIQLPSDITYPHHAVETSVGNIIILHELAQRNIESGSSEKGWKMGWVISEVTSDGQMVIRRFIPSNETQKLDDPKCLSLDSDDRVFVADEGNHRVILLDSQLKWNRILCPINEEENWIRWPERLRYDEKKKQLIVGGFSVGQGVNVYTFSRK